MRVYVRNGVLVVVGVRNASGCVNEQWLWRFASRGEIVARRQPFRRRDLAAWLNLSPSYSRFNRLLDCVNRARTLGDVVEVLGR